MSSENEKLLRLCERVSVSYTLPNNSGTSPVNRLNAIWKVTQPYLYWLNRLRRRRSAVSGGNAKFSTFSNYYFNLFYLYYDFIDLAFRQYH